MWREIFAKYELDGAPALILRLCEVEDRLFQVRTEIDRIGISDAAALLATEVKLTAQFRQIWKALRLGDDIQPRSVGRPPEKKNLLRLGA